ncbi:MAG: hypothetical protein ACOH1T_05550 [Microbacteriaceae bacterium]
MSLITRIAAPYDFENSTRTTRAALDTGSHSFSAQQLCERLCFERTTSEARDDVDVASNT